MPIFNIHHLTQYQYDRPVKESVSTVRLFPLSDALQNIRQFELNITHDPDVEVFSDYYGNRVGDFSVAVPHTFLSINCRMTVATEEQPELNILPLTSLADITNQISSDIKLLQLATPERIASQQTILDILNQSAFGDLSVGYRVWACCNYIYDNFSYVKGITNVETTVDEILAHRSGVCQDFAHVLLQMLRTMGIPSRYVSGYICPNKTGLRGEGATHAWVEYYEPELGWQGIDPTNNVWVNGYHVKLATGSHFNDCSPVKGTFKGIAHQSLSVVVSIGYEDGHVVEDTNEVQLVGSDDEKLEPWQDEWMQAQQ